MKKINDDDFQEIDLEDIQEEQPELSQIDADEDFDDFEDLDILDDEDEYDVKQAASKSSASNGKRKKKKKKKGFQLNLHMVLISAILIVLVISVVKLVIWNKGHRENTTSDNPTEFNTESQDNIVPLNATDSSTVDKGDLDILFMGNAPLSDDRDSEDGLVNIIKRKTGATVYNCSIAGTFMTSLHSTYRNMYPNDGLSFYDLCTIFTVGNTTTLEWATHDFGGELPEGAKEATDLLQTIDYDKLDAICIYYDASDYLEQRPPYDDENSSNIKTFIGAMEAGVKLIQDAHPNVRIIVMGPTYAYYVDESGKYLSSYSADTAEYTLNTYVAYTLNSAYLNNISFVDNMYGAIYEEIADEYLTDNIHLNVAGREKVADRFVYALNRFNDYDFSAYENN